MSIAKQNDFYVDVPNIGQFRFNRKTYGSVIQMQAERLRVLRGIGDEDSEMRGHATIVSTYKTLMVECPAGWEDLESIDVGSDPEKEDQILAVYFALKEKLDSFRQPIATNETSEKAS